MTRSDCEAGLDGSEKALCSSLRPPLHPLLHNVNVSRSLTPADSLRDHGRRRHRRRRNSLPSRIVLFVILSFSLFLKARSRYTLMSGQTAASGERVERVEESGLNAKITTMKANCKLSLPTVGPELQCLPTGDDAS